MTTETTGGPEVGDPAPGPFFLFAGDEYYPLGVANDLRGVFAHLDEALAAAGRGAPWDWAHIAAMQGERLQILWVGGH